MDTDISMDIRGKSVDMDMDMDGKFHIDVNPGNRPYLTLPPWPKRASYATDYNVQAALITTMLHITDGLLALLSQTAVYASCCEPVNEICCSGRAEEKIHAIHL